VETIGNASNVFLYLIAFPVFGFIYWLLDNIMNVMEATNIADTTSFTVWDFLMFVWYGIVVVYVIFGGIWLVKSFSSQEMQ